MKTPLARLDPLFDQLRWFTHLRWVAAGAVIFGAALDRRLDWYSTPGRFLAVGLIIAAYNAVLMVALWWLARRTPRRLAGLAVTQLLLDIVCLTTLMTWTGGVRSPLIGFFVFHMVFSSLLLSETAAFASAAAAIVVIGVGLCLTHNWPRDRNEALALVGLMLTLSLTVTLTNRVTRDLRAHRRRLIRQNRRVRTMTRQLRRQQQALIQHEKMVAMGQMAAGVTHEINNPLASMDSVLQLAQRHPERMRPEIVQTLRNQVARISQIIKQMKTFAHPEDAELQTLPVNDVVEEAIGMVRFDHRLRSIDVRREFTASVGSVSMLPQALQQVLVNLIINALDALANTSEPAITIRTLAREGWCVIEVSDNGCGIAPKHMSRLFEPFFTTKAIGKGTGLGLSISYSLMRKQGGDISVRSEAGKGATFVLRLPGNPAHSREREAISKSVALSEKAIA